MRLSCQQPLERDRTHRNHSLHKQLTLDNLPKATIKEENKTAKQIIITQIEAATKEDELALKVDFKLLPSRTVFSRVKADLWFDGVQISSVLIRILQGPLATDESEFAPTLDMKGVIAGAHVIRVEMFEWWDSDEKLWQTTKDFNVNYVPQTRESRLVRVPTVKSIAGADVAIVSESEKTLYDTIEKTIKKEQISKRDNW